MHCLSSIPVIFFIHIVVHTYQYISSNLNSWVNATIVLTNFIVIVAHAHTYDSG